MLIRKAAAALFVALSATIAIAAEPPAGAKLDRLIREALPLCPDLKITRSPLERKLPRNVTGMFVKVEGARPSCEGQYVAFTTSQGNFFIGYPWFLDEEKGTIEEKLKSFTWSKMQQVSNPVVDRNKVTRDGFFKVTVMQTTEGGKLPLEGEIDPDGTLFVLGGFRSSEDFVPARLKGLSPFIANAPATGSAKAAVTVIEFSDFECPSCQRAASFVKPLLQQHGERVRYVRYDLPLVQNHPWALSAAVAGRAIYRQKPDLFWSFKDRIYENQSKLSAFTIDDFARGFAQDHELDIAKYDADVASADLRNEILRGAGAAFSNDVRATPTYLVNGVFVDAGPDGKGLLEYVERLLAK